MVLLTLAINDRLKGTPNVKALAVSPGAVASDIWRSWPRWYRTLVLDPAMKLLFLDNDKVNRFLICPPPFPPCRRASISSNHNHNVQPQGSTPSVYAATHPLHSEDEHDAVPYYQPYWTPGPHFLFPFEACGPFNGWTKNHPRLPRDAQRVAKELWFTSERCLQQCGHAS